MIVMKKSKTAELYFKDGLFHLKKGESVKSSSDYFKILADFRAIEKEENNDKNNS